MVKIRYFRLRLPATANLAILGVRASESPVENRILALSISSQELILRFTTIRHVRTVQYAADGTEIPTMGATMEQHAIRLFSSDFQTYLAIVDPPRGDRLVSDLLTRLMPHEQFFVEALELTPATIERHISFFESAKLVSAKVRDFQIYEKAVARLEVTSKEGLPKEMAPFLRDKFYRVELLTFEVTHQFSKGLVSYFANGSIKVSTPLVEVAFKSFEEQLNSYVTNAAPDISSG